MKWGAFAKSAQNTGRPLATCEADSHHEAVRKLAKDCPLLMDNVNVEPINEAGRSHVGRFYSQTGPVLSEEEIRREAV